MSDPITVITLEEDSVVFGGMHLCYSFSVRAGAGSRSFLIRVEKGEERAEADAGDDLSRALGYYRKIVFGTVTPCTLSEVLRDLRYA